MISPIPVAEAMRTVDEKLIVLLKSLTEADWHRPTTARLWTVKDTAAHLLDGNLRTLSLLRDGYVGDPPDAIHAYDDLLGYLNRLNADWVRATRRLSPAVLISLLEVTGPAYHDYLESLDPFAPAVFAVAWAGEEQSPNWFHIAREYTEKWHHQQQIRLATGRGETELLSKELFEPFLQTVLRALPHHYREVPGRVGDCLQLSVTGAGGGDWFLIWNGERWELTRDYAALPTARVQMPDQVAWRVFMKSIDPDEARACIRVTGDSTLTEPLLSVRAVMA